MLTTWWYQTYWIFNLRAYTEIKTGIDFALLYFDSSDSESFNYSLNGLFKTHILNSMKWYCRSHINSKLSHIDDFILLTLQGLGVLEVK